VPNSRGRSSCRVLCPLGSPGGSPSQWKPVLSCMKRYKETGFVRAHTIRRRPAQPLAVGLPASSSRSPTASHLTTATGLSKIVRRARCSERPLHKNAPFRPEHSRQLGELRGFGGRICLRVRTTRRGIRGLKRIREGCRAVLPVGCFPPRMRVFEGDQEPGMAPTTSTYYPFRSWRRTIA
jgi:hypothetical protein